jgi:hypothetical protein
MEVALAKEVEESKDGGRQQQRRRCRKTINYKTGVKGQRGPGTGSQTKVTGTGK